MIHRVKGRQDDGPASLKIKSARHDSDQGLLVQLPTKRIGTYFGIVSIVVELSKPSTKSFGWDNGANTFHLTTGTVETIRLKGREAPPDVHERLRNGGDGVNNDCSSKLDVGLIGRQLFADKRLCPRQRTVTLLLGLFRQSDVFFVCLSLVI
jgi:hypothetical protein